ncbi:hypothetical protein NDU88_004837 [Pleurodeles waltl]|uniref:Uncharacterized protein n=1 Tax=Pleurodeles waltl TaxID=8319 RepID=A0AAV7KZ32_PLEWA|nr:hypothetical protein NDU88_004837 [Pleurodeles waltl]
MLSVHGLISGRPSMSAVPTEPNAKAFAMCRGQWACLLAVAVQPPIAIDQAVDSYWMHSWLMVQLRRRDVELQGLAARNGHLSRTQRLTASGLTWCAEPCPSVCSGTGGERGCRGSRERYYLSTRGVRHATRHTTGAHK